MDVPSEQGTPFDTEFYGTDQLCDEFEQRWLTGDAPRLEDFVAKVPEAQQDRLLRELLLVEIELRGRSGETPRSVDYLSRFPEQTAVIDDAFRQAIDETPTVQPDSPTVPARSDEPKDNVSFPGYEIVGELGRGGMGVVYKARQEKLNRVVALKTIRTGDLASDEEVKRFLAEAEAAAKLEHPHIVPIHEIGEHGGQHFFSMGFVDGPSLKEKLAEGVFEPRAAAELVRTLAEAVQYAHERGIVHRDLKPANVLLAASDQRSAVAKFTDRLGSQGLTAESRPLTAVPRITDFGLAKQIEADSSMTATGQVLGTPSYMPPEQAAGEISQIGPRSDVYSLGAILYALLTGRPPFQAANVLETLKQVMERDPVPPRQLNPSVDRDLETICLKCLEKDSEKRYSAATELADDLGSYLRREPITARPIGRVERVWRWCRRNPIVAALSGAALFLLVTGVIVSGSLAAWALSEADRADGEAELADRRADEYLVQRKEAERQKGIALDQKGIAETQKQVAQTKAKEAEDARRESDQRLKRNEVLLYASQVSQALEEWKANRVDIARNLLDNTQPNLRDWEYHYLDWLFNRSHVTLRGHGRHIAGVAFSPDGKHVASAGGHRFKKRPGVVRIWDVKQQRELHELSGHTGEVYSVEYSPDGKQLVTGSGDNSLKLWNAETGQVIRTFSGHTSKVTSVAISPDGSQIVSGSHDRMVKVWDVETGEVIHTLRDHKGLVNCVAISPDGKQIAGGGHAGLRIWDSASGVVRLNFPNQKTAWSVSFSPDGKSLACASYLGPLVIYDTSDGRVVRTIGPATASVISVSYSRDGKRLVTANGDQTVALWESATGREIAVFRGHTGPVHCVRFGPHDRYVVSGGADRTLKLWDTNFSAGYFALRGQKEATAGAVACSPESNVVVSAATPGRAGYNVTVKVWDGRTGRERFTLPGHLSYGPRGNSRASRVTSLDVSPDGRRIVSGAENSTIKIWNAETGRETQTLAGHERWISDVCFSHDGKRVISSSADATVKVWDAESGRVIRTFEGFANHISCVGASGDGRYIACGSDIGIKVWDAQTGIEAWTQPEPGVECVEFSPDSRYLASGSRNTMKLRDATTGRDVRSMRRQSHFGIASIAFTPDGRRIVTSGGIIWDVREGVQLVSLSEIVPVGIVKVSRDGRLLTTGTPAMLWTAKRGAERITLPGHARGVNCVAFSPNRRRIVSTSSDGNVVLWDADSGRRIWTAELPSTSQMCVAFSPDGNQIAIGGTRAEYVKRNYRNKVGVLNIYSAKTGRKLYSFNNLRLPVRAVAFSPDGKMIARYDGTVKICSVESKQEVKTLGPNARGEHIAFSPDGKRMAVGDFSGRNLNVWDITSGEKVVAFPGHAGSVYAVSFSPDGRHLASAGLRRERGRRGRPRGIIKVWDAQTGREVHSITDHDGTVTCVAFSPDGRYMVSGSYDTTLKIWDVKTGRHMHTLAGHRREVTSVDVSTDGQRIVSCSADSTIKVWDFPAIRPPAAKSAQ